MENLAEVEGVRRPSGTLSHRMGEGRGEGRLPLDLRLLGAA